VHPQRPAAQSFDNQDVVDAVARDLRSGAATLHDGTVVQARNPPSKTDHAVIINARQTSASQDTPRPRAAGPRDHHLGRAALRHDEKERLEAHAAGFVIRTEHPFRPGAEAPIASSLKGVAA